MGNCWGLEKGMGRERGRGGQFTSNLGPEWTGVAPYTKEGLQVSERDLGTGEGSPGKGGIIKGTCQGVYDMCLILSTLYIHIVLLCECG
jgi:hypothetical protein